MLLLLQYLLLLLLASNYDGFDCIINKKYVQRELTRPTMKDKIRWYILIMFEPEMIALLPALIAIDEFQLAFNEMKLYRR
jgi:hypothetical protein